MSFPTSLLNRAVDAFADRLARRRAARLGRGVGTPTKSERGWTRTWWWAATGILLAAVISAFVDPQFGWNPGSVRTVASILLGFAVEIMLGWVAVIWVMRRLMPQATHSFSFRPLSLLIVVAGVVFTRLTGFEPGIVFGLVAGIGFAGAVGRAAKARSALIGLGFAFAVAIVAWLIYGLVADQSGSSLVATLLVESLASVVVGGIVGLPLALVPLRGLTGRAIWEANRTTWFACYAVGVFALFVVVLPMPGSWAEVSWSLGAWVVMYIAYAAVAVVAWAAVVRPWRAAPESAGTEPAGGGADAARVGR